MIAELSQDCLAAIAASFVIFILFMVGFWYTVIHDDRANSRATELAADFQCRYEKSHSCQVVIDLAYIEQLLNDGSWAPSIGVVLYSLPGLLKTHLEELRNRMTYIDLRQTEQQITLELLNESEAGDIYRFLVNLGLPAEDSFVIDYT